MNRRTLSAALQTGSLTKEALDFVEGSGAQRSPEDAATPPDQARGSEQPPATGAIATLRLRLEDEGDLKQDGSLVSLTVRVPRVVPPGLLLASVDRKLKRQRPWTQQEIVAEALTHWLSQHGYLS